MANPPRAPRRPHVISAHGDDREDPWFWLREREDPEVLAYLQAENAYTEEGTLPLAELRGVLFEEMKARIKETDMSVPTRRGPWWYYSRTEEGKSYAIHCRRPARGRAHGAQVVPEIHERIHDPVVLRNQGDDVDGVFFSETAEIDRHARLDSDSASRAAPRPSPAAVGQTCAPHLPCFARQSNTSRRQD